MSLDPPSPPSPAPPPSPQGVGPGPEGPAPRKKRRGCLVAVLVAGAIGLLLMVGAGIVFWKAMRVGVAGLNAPGAAELRAAGCDTAMVMRTDQFLGGTDAGSTTSPSMPAVMLSCIVAAGKTTPACEDVARTYLRAVPHPGGLVSAQVLKTGDLKPQCAKLYDESGAPR